MIPHRRNEPPRQFPVTVEIDGRTYQGHYSVTGRSKIVHVTGGAGSKSTQAGGMPPEAVARMLLRELVEEGRRNARQ